MTDETTLAATPGDDVVTDKPAEVFEPESLDPPKPEDGKTPAEPKAADEDGGEPAEGDKPAKIPGSRREKIKNDILRRELADAHRQLEEAQRRLKPAAETASDDKEPQEADFNGDYFAYERAKTAFDVRKVVREEHQRLEDGKRSTEQSEAWREHVIAHKERIEEAKDVITDFDQVLASAKDIKINPEVGKEILLSEKSALLTYYLAKNPDKALALNGMTGRELAREIGRLEGSVRMPAAKKQTTTPAPLTTVRGGSAPSFDPSSSSMEEYVAKRTAGWSG